MKPSTVLCLVLLTVIFASSLKLCAGFPSAAPEKISDDLKTFEGRSLISRRSLPNLLQSVLAVSFFSILLPVLLTKLYVEDSISITEGGIIQWTSTSQDRKYNENLSFPLFFTCIKTLFSEKKNTVLSCDFKKLYMTVNYQMIIFIFQRFQ